MAKLSVWPEGDLWRVGWVGGDVLPGDAPLNRRGASGREPKRPHNRGHWRACRAAAASRGVRHDRHAFWWASARAAKAAATACRAAVAGAAQSARTTGAERWAALPVTTRQSLTESMIRDIADAARRGDGEHEAANRAALAALNKIKPTPRQRRRTA